MNKLFAVLLLLVLWLLPALPAAADVPIPNHYFVDAGGACWLPDGNAVPSLANGTNTNFWLEKLNVLVITCNGKLPADATLPRVITKLEYRDTGLLCVGKLKESERYTTRYGAIVYPDGFSTITCRFDLNATDP